MSLFGKLTPSERISKAKIKLMREYPFFGYIAMYLTFIENDKIPTMSVNPKGVIRYNPKYVEKLSDTQLLADVIHEVSHIAFRHFEREEILEITNPIHKKAYDYANDIVVNAILVANGFDVYDTGLNPEKVGRTFVTRFKFSIRGIVDVNGIKQEIVVQIPIEIWDPEQKSSEEVYFEILEQLKGNGGGNSNVKILLPGCSNCSDQNSRNCDLNSLSDLICNISDLINSMDIIEVSSDKKPFDIHEYGNNGRGEKENESQDWSKIIAEAYNYAKMVGKVPARIERHVEAVLKPKIDWKKVLRDSILPMIPQDYTYLKPSRRSLSAGVYLPSIAKDRYLEALVAVDTSGSISGQELNQFLSEIQWIARNFPIRITLLSVDADIHDKIELRCLADVQKITGLKGGGGTDFRPVFDYAVKHRKRLIVFFTDGFGTFPERPPNIKTIWVVSPNGVPSKNFPFGKVIRINDKSQR